MKWNNKGKELDKIGNQLISKKKVVFYGISSKIIELYKRILFLNCPIVFADDNCAGEFLGEQKILSMDSMLENFTIQDSIIVVTTTDESLNLVLKKKLVLRGLDENIDFFMADIFQKIYLPIWSLYSFDKCYVDYLGHSANYACTLKCKKCSASMPYLKKKNPSLERLKEEIDLFFEKVDFLYTYDCTGGETFIVSDVLVDVLSYLFTHYSSKIGGISITSNVTVIPSERMLEFLAQYKDFITINISCYDTVPGWKEKFSAFETVMNEYNIPFNTINVTSWIDFGFSTTTLSKTTQELTTYFDNCQNFCRSYEDGKMYYCGHGYNAGVVYYPNEDTTDEYIDFRADDLTSKIITEFNLGFQNKGFLNICKHCNGWGNRNQCFIPVAEQL